MGTTSDSNSIAAQLDRDMVQVPAGPFVFGMTEDQKRDAADAAGVHVDMLHFHSNPAQLTTPEFWMDRYPVTRGQFLRFVQETGYEIEVSGWLVGWVELTAHFDFDDPDRLLWPMTGVNADDARAYARWAGKRLPTEVEWEKAARGTDGRLYPWGNDYQPVVATDGTLTLGASQPVGTRPQLASPYGVEDAAGGVLEWTQTVFTPASRDGTAVDATPWMLSGSSGLHRQPYSHMVTSRWSWHPGLRAYNTGFRCVSDAAPSAPVSCAAALTGSALTPETAAIEPARYMQEPIRLRGYDWATLAIEVPWFPDSLWVVDVPEGNWGPFGGANAWPHRDRAIWFTPWKSSQDGTQVAYERRDGSRVLKVVATAGADEVVIRVKARELGPLNLGTICVKTFSPFFSSQERLTQHRVEGGALVRACDLPLPGELSASFGWTVGDNLPDGAVITRSYDGSAAVAISGRPGADCWGNGWPHCTHIRGPAMDFEDECELRFIFAVGPVTDVISRVKARASDA